VISQLKNQIKTTKKNVRDEDNEGLEQARASDKQEIQLLKSNIDDMHKKMQVSERWTIQEDELVKQLQAKVSSIEKMVVDITLFQAQALEVLKKMKIAQQSLFTKVEIIQNHFGEVNQSLDNIGFREREATTTRTTFQEAIVSLAREEIYVTPRLTVAEQVRGDIILKTWEANIAKSKRMTKEIKEDCEEFFILLIKNH
jgi:hypothetical protein